LRVPPEAIFLPTFVMISRNRADAKGQAIADQWQIVEKEDRQNQELLDASQQIPRAHEGNFMPSRLRNEAEGSAG
jgi:hypothetical protein